MSGALSNLVTTLQNLLTTDNLFDEGQLGNLVRDFSSGISYVGFTLLVMFFMIELIEMVSKNNSGSDIFASEVFIVLIKFALAYFVLNNVDKVITFVEVLGKKTFSNVSFNPESISSSAPIISIPTKMTDKMLLFLEVKLYNVVVGVLGLICKVIVYSRFIELTLYTIFAPIPLSFLFSNEGKDMAKGYLKNYFAVILQGGLLMAVVALCGGLIKVSAATTAWALFKDVFMYTLLLVFSMFKTGQWAKSILGSF